MNRVFISYVRENIEVVDRLCQDLKSRGIQVWLDRNDIGPGLRWKREIRLAIQQGAFFIACFSKEYNDRDRTYMNEELTIAIEELRLRPQDRIWFIPVKLNECEVPDRDIGGGETLRDVQHVNLFEDWDSGIQMILRVVYPASSEPSINANISVGGTEQNVRTEFAEAVTCQDRKQYHRAIKHYTQVLELNPQIIEAYNNRGNIYNQQGKFDLAIDDYTRAIILKPDEVNAYYNRGMAYYEKGDIDRAIEDFTRALVLKPNLLKAYHNRGAVYANQGNFHAAIEDFDKAIQLNPNLTVAYNNRGMAYKDMGDYARAIDDYNRVINLKPDFGKAYHNRAVVWLYLQEWEKARTDLITAKNMGVDITKSFGETFVSIHNFERITGVRLPAEIATLLTN